MNGAAYAGGLEWACFADIRIAEEHATFGVTCRRWNIGLADGFIERDHPDRRSDTPSRTPGLKKD